MTAPTAPGDACVVTVTFQVAPAHWDDFLVAVKAQAAASLSLEPACRVFDIAVADTTVFLYEVYDSRADFDAHLDTPHFAAFDAAVRPWVLAKTVSVWTAVR